jgi:hypothetical protein
VAAESSILFGQDQWTLPPGTAPGDPVENAQQLLRAGVPHVGNI